MNQSEERQEPSFWLTSAEIGAAVPVSSWHGKRVGYDLFQMNINEFPALSAQLLGPKRRKIGGAEIAVY